MLRFAIIAAVFVGVALSLPQFVSGIFGDAPPLTDGTTAVVTEPEPAAEAAVAAVELDEPYIPVANRQTVVHRDDSGHFIVNARIKGKEIPAMIDTGASTIAITIDTARALGIEPDRNDFTVDAYTANGRVRAAPVMLPEVRIGKVRVRDVEAMVLSGDGLDVTLIGMSFLNRLERYEQSGGELVLVE